jgi:Asp/Glu/hydantoin racemase
MALKYCFVDASNLNSVKEQARLEVIGSVESLMSERFRVILLASLVLGLCSP